MVFPIVLIGQAAKNKYTIKRLCRALQLYGGVLYYSPQEGREFPKGEEFPKFVLCEGNQMQELAFSRGMVIFDHPDDLSSIPSGLSEGMTYLVEEGDSHALFALNMRDVLTITCGMSSKATLTISSIGEEKSVVSLQREAVDLKGNRLLPKEVAVRLCQKTDDYLLMVITAILLLTGEIEEECIIQ